MAPSQVSARPAAWRRIVPSVVAVGIWIGGQFLAAGRWDWTRGWIAVAVYAVSMSLVGAIMRRSNPGLMTERANWKRKETKSYDKVIVPIIAMLGTLQPVLAGWEAGRPGRETLSMAAAWAGVVLCMLASAVVGWVMAVNRHAETTVRIQADRGHTVVTTGPYRFVRHPMYVGCILMFAGFPLIWGTMKWTWIWSAALALVFLYRTVLEDRTLRAELPGYEQYASRTRFRLVPGLW
jgi:protein-S-isoprenylcysteine O-methyltransferase Ste14